VSDTLQLCEATPEDISVLAQFNVEMARETENRALDLALVTRGVHGLFQHRSRGVYYVAREQGRVVGQLLITYEWSDWRNGDFWWIQSVYVAPDFRGRGVFKALYRHVEALARLRPDVCGLRLYVEAANLGAQETYRRLGMTKTHYEMFEIDFTAPPL
jgi:ribosomal protein S18 acetylase RimI-like enzyme